jgi:drug/metabolite transporter (DMT)-like permease
MPAQQVICWVLVGSLPFTLPWAVWLWPTAPVRASAWLGFAYASVFSMWLGFFAWYRGLALGGVVRVSQVQLLQPFLALLFAVPVLGERLRPVDAVVHAGRGGRGLVGRRMPVARPI